jgi:hypothetical protein
MLNDPQSLLVLAVVAAAAVYLSRRAWRVIFGGKATHCGSSCGGCGDKQLVSLDAPNEKPVPERV